MKRFRFWLASHPWLIASFGLGVLVGLALRLPLFPWVLPDSSAAMIGAAFGSLVAVGGAAWFTLHQQNAPAAQAKRRILGVLEGFLAEIRAAIRKAEAWERQDFDASEAQRFGDLVSELGSSHLRTGRMLLGMRADFMAIGPIGLVALSDAQAALGDLTSFGGRPEWDREVRWTVASCRARAEILLGKFGDTDSRLRRFVEVIELVRAQ